MGKSCCVPRCHSGYKGVDMTGITMHTFRPSWKEKIPRGGNWNLSKNHGICSKHFVESDFVTTTVDSNSRRKRQNLRKHYITDDAVPTLFPNCPKYLSKKKKVKRASMGSSEKRKTAVKKRLEEYQKREREKDTARSFKDIEKLASIKRDKICETNLLVEIDG